MRESIHEVVKNQANLSKYLSDMDPHLRGDDTSVHFNSVKYEDF